jgi:hypothetical protein
MSAPTGEWKSIAAGVLTAVSVALWMYVLLKKFGLFFKNFVQFI